MPRSREFLSLSDDALRAVIGPSSRHLALIEDAFKVLIEAPGGGVSIDGGPRDRANARRVIEALAERSDLGADISEADVRTGIGAVLGGGASTKPAKGSAAGPPTAGGVALPVGRKGAIVPKTPAQAICRRLANAN